MISNLNRNSCSIECRNFIKQRKLHMQINVRDVRYQETDVNLKLPFYKSILFLLFCSWSAVAWIAKNISFFKYVIRTGFTRVCDLSWNIETGSLENTEEFIGMCWNGKKSVFGRRLNLKKYGMLVYWRRPEHGYTPVTATTDKAWSLCEKIYRSYFETIIFMMYLYYLR